jgi:hypothetical protein
VGSDNRGCATIATSFGTFTTRFALGTFSSGTATEGRVIEWVTGSSAYIAAGQILQQTASDFSGGLSGNYAFEQGGVDGSNGRLGGVGVISASGGHITTGEMDMNDAGTTSTITGMTGTYTSPDSNGRLTLTITAPSTVAGSSVGYMVSSSQLLFMSTNLPTTNGVAAGEAKQQSGTFSNSSVGGNMVFYVTGLNSGGSGGMQRLDSSAPLEPAP